MKIARQIFPNWKFTCMAFPYCFSLYIKWSEEPGGLQSIGSQRVGHDWVTNIFMYINIHVFIWASLIAQIVYKVLIIWNFFLGSFKMCVCVYRYMYMHIHKVIPTSAFLQNVIGIDNINISTKWRPCNSWAVSPGPLPILVNWHRSHPLLPLILHPAHFPLFKQILLETIPVNRWCRNHSDRWVFTHIQKYQQFSHFFGKIYIFHRT